MPSYRIITIKLDICNVQDAKEELYVLIRNPAVEVVKRYYFNLGINLFMRIKRQFSGYYEKISVIKVLKKWISFSCFFS